jgi:hypothetical protein
VIDTGLHAEAKEWHAAAKVACNRDGHFRGVTLDVRDILDAIQERAASHSVTTIYFATDGWMRGPHGARLVKEVVGSLRRRRLTVVGLWKLPGLANFNDGKEFNPIHTLGKENQVNHHSSSSCCTRYPPEYHPGITEVSVDRNPGIIGISHKISGD